MYSNTCARAFSSVAKAFAVDRLDLEAVIPRFHGCIVVAVAFFAHDAISGLFRNKR